MVSELLEIYSIPLERQDKCLTFSLSSLHQFEEMCSLTSSCPSMSLTYLYCLLLSNRLGQLALVASINQAATLHSNLSTAIKATWYLTLNSATSIVTVTFLRKGEVILEHLSLGGRDLGLMSIVSTYSKPCRRLSGFNLVLMDIGLQLLSKPHSPVPSWALV